MMQALCVVSPEWVRETGGLHDPDNPRNIALFKAARAWAEEWAGEGSVITARLDLDEAGGSVVDLCISPIRSSRGKPRISTNKPLQELKAATGERNEFAALQTSWAAYAACHLDTRIRRGTRKQITRIEHVSPETYGRLKDRARREAERDLDVKQRQLQSREAWMNARYEAWEQQKAHEGRDLARERAKISQMADRAKAMFEKSKRLLMKVEALSTIASSDLLSGFATLRSVVATLLVRAKWVQKDRSGHQQLSEEAEITPEQYRNLSLASEAISAAVDLQELQAKIDNSDVQDDPDYDSGFSGP
ncbi:hypothetical protein [Microvirga sp. 2TAF3]|uniref:hypothetical protein n=1 Tax=Microvirga sp. 2TAF3 TaxID=3233014 RepID=UPI003F944A8F